MGDPTERVGAFLEEVLQYRQSLPDNPFDLVMDSLVGQGIDPDEIRPELTVRELSDLGLFRSQLRVVAPKTGVPFEVLKRRVSAAQLPHHAIDAALVRHAQKADERKGSDLVDGHLSSLAAYADILYVDKRVAENFRRALQKDPALAPIVGDIKKASNWQSILADLS
jgi:hypothetical protein